MAFQIFINFFSVSDFNNNLFECVSPDQYEIKQFDVPQQYPKIQIVLENELSIYQPLVYENVSSIKSDIPVSQAKLVIEPFEDNIIISIFNIF